MKKDSIIKLWENRGFSIGDPSGVTLFVSEDKESVPTKMNRELINTIYATDPLTNKPMNDLVLAVNQHLPSEIREWIKQNIQAPQSPENVPQDLELGRELLRLNSETEYEYLNRIRQIAIDGEDLIKSDVRRSKIIKSKK